MSNEQDKILSMVEEGTISAEEAQGLLAAMDESLEGVGAAASPATMPTQGTYADYWRAGFTRSLAVFGAGLVTLSFLRRVRGPLAGVGRMFAWPAVIIGGVGALLSYLSRNSPWLHVDVESADGQKVNLHLPLPLPVARKALETARQQVTDEEAQQQIAAAAEFIDAAQSGEIKDPLTVDLQDGEGTVRIYLG